MEKQSNTDAGVSTPRAKRFFVILMLGGLLLVGKTLAPLAGPLFVGAVLTVVLWPLQERLSRKFKGRRAPAALILVVGIAVLAVGPLLTFSAVVVAELKTGYEFVSKTIHSEGLTGLVSHLPDSIERIVRKAIDLLPSDTAQLGQSLGHQLAAGGGHAAAAVTAALSATGSIAFGLAITLVALFCLLIQGKELALWIDSVTPVRRGQLIELLLNFKQVSYSIIVSTLLTSAAQSIVALIGYLIARLPHAFFFTALTFVASLIPAVGASFACLAAALLLFATGHTYMAVFLALWGLFVVGVVDNVLKPILIRGGGAQMNTAIVFFALLGGVASFGPLGLLLGPLAVSLFLALSRIYQRDFASTTTPTSPAGASV